MKTKMWFLTSIGIIIAVCIFYFGGCKQNLNNEPESSNNESVQLEKAALNHTVTFEQRKILLQKFFKEVDEARLAVKAKWKKIKTSGLNSAMALPPAEQEAMDLANAITPSAYSYVYSAYGVDLYNYFSPGDPNIALTGVLIGNVDGDMQSGTIYELDGEPLSSVESRAYFGNHLRKTSNVMKAKWIECMEEATGVGGFIAMMYGGGASTLSAMGVIKLAGKVIARTMSWIGAAVALAEFTYCMYH